MDKTHHADDETLEYIASLEQKNARLRGACESALDKIERGIGLSHMVAEKLRAALKDAQ